MVTLMPEMVIVLFVGLLLPTTLQGYLMSETVAKKSVDYSVKSIVNSEGKYICAKNSLAKYWYDIVMVPEHQLCDGEPQCPLWDDEMFCPLKCRSDEIKCHNSSKCARVCDGMPQCKDGEDELRCCGFTGSLQCPSGKLGVVCNSIVECNGDGDHDDDEKDCACPTGSYTCPTGKCAIRCNGINECTGPGNNHEDEKLCKCPKGNIQCPSGKCGIVCNNVIECDDAIMDKDDDEMNCACPSEFIRCPSGKCGSLCNGVVECDGDGDGGEDESLKICPCPDGNVRCPSGKCAVKCNGITECDGDDDNNDDERFCECASGNIRCPSGKCGVRCNSVNDCNDYAAGDEDDDEQNCGCPCGTVTCPSGKCGGRCNGKVECDAEEDDDDDEENCGCPKGLYRCPSGICAYLCNKFTECIDIANGDLGQDEEFCACEKGYITCPNSRLCAIPCDGIVQCTGDTDNDYDESEERCPCLPHHVRCGGTCAERCNSLVECVLPFEFGIDENGCDNNILFRVTAGAAIGDIGLAWETGVDTTSDPKCANTRKDGCETHYRNPDLDDWLTLNPKKLKYAIYSDNVEVASFVFDASSSDRYDWFRVSNLLSTSYNDLLSTTVVHADYLDRSKSEGVMIRWKFWIQQQGTGACDVPAWTMIVDSHHGAIHPCPNELDMPLPHIFYADNFEIGTLGTLSIANYSRKGLTVAQIFSINITTDVNIKIPMILWTNTQME